MAGMQVLDRLDRIGDATICHAFYIGQRRKEHDYERARQDLAGQLSDVEKFRSELLEKQMPDEELDRMLEICNDPDNGIDVALWELRDEIEFGTIHETEQVKRAYEIDAAECARQAQNEARSKQALPPHQSFRKFCLDANIRYLCDVPIGAYGVDWGHQNMMKLDEEIVYAGLQYKSTKSFACTEESEHSSRFGRVGFPVVLLEDGRELMLQTAHYHDDQMWVGACPVREKGELVEWKLDELAALKPQMVGITLGRYDRPTAEEIERGYALVKRSKLPKLVASLAQKFGG